MTQTFPTITPTPAPGAPPVRWQFSLRSLLVLCFVAACGLWAWNKFARPYRAHQRAIARVEKLGGKVRVEWQGPDWLRSGKSKYFDRVVAIDLSPLAGSITRDDDLAFLRELPELRELNLRGTAITDRACEQLRQLNELTELYLSKTGVSLPLAEIATFPKLRIVELGDVNFPEIGSTTPGTLHLDQGGTRASMSMTVGYRSQGTVTIDQGSGLGIQGEAALARLYGSEATVSVRGRGSHWESETLSLAEGGHARMTASEESRIEVATLQAAWKTFSEATLLLEGPGTWCRISKTCHLGNDGQAALEVQGGAGLDIGGFLKMASDVKGDSTFTVTGTGSRAVIRGEMAIGAIGRGRVVVDDGATIESCEGVALGGFARRGSEGSAVVRGNGTWTIGYGMAVGQHGTGTLELTDGGSVAIQKGLVIGRGEDSRGMVSVGEGCGLSVKDQIEVGRQGQGSLHLAPMAKLSASGIEIGPQGDVDGARELPKVANRGLLVVGAGPNAELVVRGDYTEEPTGVLRVVIGEGSRASRLIVAADAALAGRLELRLTNGVQPAPGSSYTVVSARRVLSPFKALDPPAGTSRHDWHVTYTPEEVRVTYRP